MKMLFHKYQAAGNDFILFDNRDRSFPMANDIIARLCDRKFGIGADGIILIGADGQQPFKVTYLNPDGSQSLCGNGCRAAVKFAQSLNLTDINAVFNTYDGTHRAQIKEKSINLSMADVQNGREIETGIFLDTGSPHFVLFVEDVHNYDVMGEGRKWRYSEHFKEGANVNFVELAGSNHIYVRTYERGVENETLSCGTGVTAAALAAAAKGLSSPVTIDTKGGQLQVSFEKNENGYSNVWLEGPAEHVFSGEIEV
jgi:diaminopimelate epimerase